MIDSLYPAFKRWSDGGSVWLISDTHFDDEDREYMGYDISEKGQMAIIKDFVHKPDTLIHLGDVGDPEYLNELKCYKVLIMGNHDESKEKMKKYFDEVYDGPIWVSQKLILSHEPIDVLPYAQGGQIAFNIHGHEHNISSFHPSDINHLNLAANVVKFIPVNLKDIIKSGALKQIKSIHRYTIESATNRKLFGQYETFIDFMQNY